MRLSRRTLLVLPVAAACSGAGRVSSLYVSPEGVGDGASWETAADIHTLDDLLARLTPGGSIFVAADRGAYELRGPIELSVGGRARAPLHIGGVNSSTGAPQAAVLRGARAGEEQGDDAFRLLRHASYLHFSHFGFEAVGNGCIRVAGPNAGLVVEDCTFDNVYRFFENTAGRDERHATLRNFEIRRCTGVRVERSFARIRYASSDGVIEDCSAEGLPNEGGNIPGGIALDDQAHAIVMRRCVMRNFQQWRAGTYWNGDGFSDEERNYDIVYEACEAYGATDGGFDCKSRGVVLRDCIAADNKRNYRIWSENATLTNCISRDPNFRGVNVETTSPCHIWVGHEHGVVRIDGLQIVDSGEPEDILDLEYEGSRVEIHGVSVEATRENWGDDAERVQAEMIVSR